MINFNNISYSVAKHCRTKLTQSQSCETILKRLCSLCSNSSSESKPRRVLGIETSCDDTGAAVVDEYGNILGNALNSQTSISVALGGVIPPHAQALHKTHIDQVVQDALLQANVQVKDLDAVAVTVKPGLGLCLQVGVSHAKKLVLENRVPMIPIHHMEAHALTARMIDKINFPFLVLLVSGGHCLLAVARDIDRFLLLGKSLDNAPGEAFDKIARGLNLKNLPECADMSGGAMIELMARAGDITAVPAPDVNALHGTCNFSFAGLKSHYKRCIEEEERKQGIVASHVLSNASDVCASFQYAVIKHLARSLQRAFLYCDMKQLLPESNRTLVVSGGVACNQFIREGLQKVCDRYDSSLVCPPPHLCTDNGIMIAWNGMEKLLAGRGFAEDPESVRYTPKVPFGEDATVDVSNVTIKIPKINLL